MTSRERILCAVELGTPDRVAVTPWGFGRVRGRRESPSTGMVVARITLSWMGTRNGSSPKRRLIRSVSGHPERGRNGSLSTEANVLRGFMR